MHAAAGKVEARKLKCSFAFAAAQGMDPGLQKYSATKSIGKQPIRTLSRSLSFRLFGR